MTIGPAGSGTITLDGTPNQELVVLLVPANEADAFVLQLGLSEMVADDIVVVTGLTNMGASTYVLSAELEYGVTTNEMWAAPLGDPDLSTGWTSAPVPINGYGSGNSVTFYATYTGLNAGFDLNWAVYAL
jgi:hypothetical protein